MDVMEILDEMKFKAKEDPGLCRRLLQTEQEKFPYDAFCTICRQYGYEVWPMDVVEAGEEMYAAIKRSTNGGGENSPMLEGQDDLYRMFLDEIRMEV